MQELNQAKIVELTVAETEQVEGGIIPLLIFALPSAFAGGFAIGTAINRMLR